MKRALVLSTLTFVSVALGCGGGATGKAVQPKDPTAKSALNEPTSTIKECKPAPGTPLVVDLKSNERSDFELAMKDGVAVVSYNCKELRLLKSCTMQGVEYTFTSVTLKEDVVQLATKDDIMANIPISGAKLSASLESGSTLELALITVGKKHYKKPIFQEELTGECDGATHVVRGAYIGAFAMGTGTVGQASAVADMFGAGAGGSSVSKRKATTKDGDLVACRGQKKDDDAPPDACQAITRLDLSPIRPGAPTKKVAGGNGGANTPPPSEPGVDIPPPAEEPAPPPTDVTASSKVASAKPGKKKPKTAGKKPSAPTQPSLHAASASAAPPMAQAESAEVEETPSCPEGFAWNGIICKKQ